MTGLLSHVGLALHEILCWSIYVNKTASHFELCRKLQNLTRMLITISVALQGTTGPHKDRNYICMGKTAIPEEGVLHVRTFRMHCRGTAQLKL